MRETHMYEHTMMHEVKHLRRNEDPNQLKYLKN